MTTNTKNYIAWSLRIVIAFLFILSAAAKLSKSELFDSPYFAISTFEVKQLYPMGFSENFAPYFSRILIGIELALGFLLLQKHFLRRFVIPVTTLLLLVFVGHLTYVTFISGGNIGNCGCFGELLPMTPIEAIIKNVVAIGLLAWLYMLLPKNEKDGNFWILTTVLFATILGIFMLAPIQPKAVELPAAITDTETPADSTALPETTGTVDLPETIEKATDTVKKPDAPKVQMEPAPHKSGYKSYFADIDKGKKLLCFLVPGCDHCRDAAKEITELRRKDKNFPAVRIIFMNEEADLIPEFFKYAGAEYPYKIIDVIPFWNVLGSGKDTPGIKYLWNGNEYKYYWGITDNKFNPEDLEKLINKPFSELPKK
ncbi:MauE/DoxX family redox-associated membrane protein [Flavobacterium pallidum]|uniref:Protein tlpB n=1 Tax=Flavobacterium pallidum TaxID=2172098 RepID=A0A2S1SIK0_9FLAO|nr:MauE/DoxX family redox-associated membrane protein [Flavobacterium pallidum]AWI26243.1 protein tlpB [Flavobacterium pallidum]